IRIYRISRINYNVSGLGGKVIIKWCFHFEASRRCVTQRRKERVKSNPLQMIIAPIPKTSSVILKIMIQN
ncbi:MAG: hypothetical protein NWQ18_08855, partial [Saprospiraceae bacterium]|nr:hypothetical protein [Saprospiraceae bacterium]